MERVRRPQRQFAAPRRHPATRRRRKIPWASEAASAVPARAAPRTTATVPTP